MTPLGATPVGSLAGFLAAERFAAALLPHAPDAVAVIFDKDFRVHFADEGLLQRYGYSSAAVIGRAPADLLPADTWESLKAVFGRILTGKALVTAYTTSSGHPFRLHGTPIAGPSGGVEGGLRVCHEEVTPLEDRLTQRLSQQSAVAALGRSAISGELGADDLIERAVRLVVDTLPSVQWSSVVQPRPDGRSMLVLSDSCGRLTGRDLGLEGSLAERVMASPAPVVVTDADAEAEPLPALLTEAGVRSAACVTIGPPRAPFGLLSAFSDRPAAFCEDDVHFLSSLANAIAEATRRGEIDAEMRRQALRDDVTGLANRALLEDRLHQALAVA